MPIGLGTRVPQQVDPNVLSILKAALVGAGRDVGSMGRGALSQLGQGTQSSAFPFVPPVNLGRINVSAPAPQAGIMPTVQAAPLPTPQAAPTAAPAEPTAAKTKEKGQGLSDTHRQLLATALRVGLPLALAGFGGQRGLAMGAGLAKGFGERAAQQRKTEALKDQPVFTFGAEGIEQIGTVPKGSKVIKKPAESKKSKLREAVKGEVTPAREAGKPIAKQVQKATARAEGKLPSGVTEEDIKFTMQKHNLTRQQVLDALK